MQEEEREVMEFDVLIVGGGPSGLSAAIKLKQQADAEGKEISVCLVDKGSEIGAHLLSGAVMESRALEELFPNWQELGAPLNVPAKKDKVFMFLSSKAKIALPNIVAPRTMHNGKGTYIVSEGNVARWLAEQAEAMGVEIYPGFTAAEVLYGENDQVLGVITGAMGVGSDGQPKDGYVPSMELRAKYTLFAEGARGHLGKQLIAKYKLDEGKDAQHYGIGVKEVWDIPPEVHDEGLIIHGSGWPLSESKSTGGFFLYHGENNQIYFGLIADLSYKNPTMSPFEEMQLLKTHPAIKHYFENGKRVAYGARAITKGGYNCLPKQSFPGGLLIGCDAGTLNFAKIKGIHMAMKSGIVAAETVYKHLQENSETLGGDELEQMGKNWEESWGGKELKSSRNFGPAMHKFGDWFGGMYNFIEQNILFGKSPITLHDPHPDYAQFKLLADVKARVYPKPDNKLTFDKLSSVFLANVYHEEDQPCHLRLADPNLPITDTLPKYGAPLCLVCPAGVYEIVEEGDSKRFQVNFANCVHCKTCDIKDPLQNITWVTPEGGGGPNYPNM